MYPFMHYKNYSPTNIIVWLAYPLCLLSAFFFMFFSCSNKTSNSDSSYYQLADTTGISLKREFSMPVIPDSIQLPEQRAIYLIAHYWGAFDFGDTAYIHLPEITEQAFVNYLDILPCVPKEYAYFSIGEMLGKVIEMDPTHAMYTYFLDMYKNYLYDPNSPMRDDEYYIPVTNYILKDKVSDEATRQRAKFDLSMMLKNRKGEIAADIVYTISNGKNGNLHSLNKAYTLLYIYNPDCHACKETTSYLQTSPVLTGMVENAGLDILALYPDEDISLWQKQTTKLPASWINGYDQKQSIRTKTLYDLRAIPSLYLLDKDKRVLIKDVDVTTVEVYLKKMGQ